MSCWCRVRNLSGRVCLIAVIFAGAERGYADPVQTGGSVKPAGTESPAEPQTVEASAEELALFEAVNEYRQKQGRKPLAVQPELCDACQVLADGIARTGMFSHNAVGGSPGARARTAGYEGAIYENIYYRGQFAEQDSEKLAGRTLQSWINSPGHQANLLNGQVEDCGIAIVTNEQSKRTYVVMKYGKRKAESQPGM